MASSAKDLMQDACFEKGLLNHLAGSQSSGFQLYLHYFKTYCLAHADSNVFACESRAKSERLAKKALYNNREDRRPAYFDCSNVQVRKKAKKVKVKVKVKVRKKLIFFSFFRTSIDWRFWSGAT